MVENELLIDTLRLLFQQTIATVQFLPAYLPPLKVPDDAELVTSLREWVGADARAIDAHTHGTTDHHWVYEYIVIPRAIGATMHMVSITRVGRDNTDITRDNFIPAWSLDTSWSPRRVRDYFADVPPEARKNPWVHAIPDVLVTARLMYG